MIEKKKVESKLFIGGESFLTVLLEKRNLHLHAQPLAIKLLNC